jgi:hypothetical protein
VIYPFLLIEHGSCTGTHLALGSGPRLENRIVSLSENGSGTHLESGSVPALRYSYFESRTCIFPLLVHGSGNLSWPGSVPLLGNYIIQLMHCGSGSPLESGFAQKFIIYIDSLLKNEFGPLSESGSGSSLFLDPPCFQDQDTRPATASSLTPKLQQTI